MNSDTEKYLSDDSLEDAFLYEVSRTRFRNRPLTENNIKFES